MKQKDRLLLMGFLLCTLSFLAGVIYTKYLLDGSSAIVINQSQERNLTYESGLRDEVLDIIEDEHISDDIDAQNLYYGSIKGMVSALDDGYTAFYTPEENEQLANFNSSRYEGIGVTLTFNQDANYVQIESVVDDFPAFQNDVRAKDFIIEVEGEDMEGQTARYVASKVLGEAGTDVNIKLAREGENGLLEKTITRQRIDLDNITYEVLEGGILKIDVIKFTEASLQEFVQKWDEVVANGLAEVGGNPSGVILDLRSNPGGFVEGARYVLDDFTNRTDELFYEFSNEDGKLSKYSRRNGKLQNISTVVLINEGSASASEIVAGVLREKIDAKLVGKPTVGKGVEQKVLDFDDGSTLHLVFKQWFTAGDVTVSKEEPLEPDFEIEEFEDLETDDALNKAIELLSK